MLPRTPARVGPASIAARYRPATRDLAIGGDWYDVIELDDQRLGVAVGDVSGHGLAAAVTMGQLRGALSAAVRATGQPAPALRVLDAHARSAAGPMTTVVSVVIDLSGRSGLLSSAGHPAPLLVTPDGTTGFVPLTPGLPVPFEPSERLRPQTRVALPSGSMLVLFSDGLVERRDETIDVGLRLLGEIVAAHHDLDVESLADTVEAEVAPHRAEQDDDLALLVIRL